MNKIGGQKSRATVSLRQVSSDSKNIFGWFLRPSYAEENGQESSGTGRRLWRVAELRKSNFKGPQSQFRNFFSPQFDQFHSRFGCGLSCGLKLRIPNIDKDKFTMHVSIRMKLLICSTN
jgi:hypothetical protein